MFLDLSLVHRSESIRCTVENAIFFVCSCGRVCVCVRVCECVRVMCVACDDRPRAPTLARWRDLWAVAHTRAPSCERAKRPGGSVIASRRRRRPRHTDDHARSAQKSERKSIRSHGGDGWAREREKERFDLLEDWMAYARARAVM